MILTWGLDRGVADKYYPRVCCEPHAEKHAALNVAMLQESGGVLLGQSDVDRNRLGSAPSLAHNRARTPGPRPLSQADAFEVAEQRIVSTRLPR